MAMSLNKYLAAKYAGKPGLLIVAGIGFTFSIFGLYNYGYKPSARRKKLHEAEEYANFVFEKENERKL